MIVQAKPGVNDHLYDEFNNQGLSPGKYYEVIGIEYHYFRLWDDCNDLILHPYYLFDILDPSIPDDWIIAANGEALLPSELSVDPYLAERFHDGDLRALEIVYAYVTKHALWQVPGKPRF